MDRRAQGRAFANVQRHGRKTQDVGRDLAVVAGGGRREVRQLDMLEDLEAAAAAGVDPAALVAFLERLDALGAAIEEYANPELVLDALMLAWPGRGRAA